MGVARAAPAHYESATGYPNKLRPLFAQLGRSAEWTALLASVREKYARRRLFMELLDTLEGKTIVQSARKGKK